MNILKTFVLILFSAFALVGCGGKTHHIETTAINCPNDGQQHVFTATSNMLARGGGVAKIAGICGGTCLDNKGNQIPCDAKIAVAAINPDRVDTLVPAVVTAGGQLGAAALQANAIRHSADRSLEASKNSAPDVVNLISQGQQQLSVAEALNKTDVAVKTATSTTTGGSGTVYKPDW